MSLWSYTPDVDCVCIRIGNKCVYEASNDEFNPEETERR